MNDFTPGAFMGSRNAKVEIEYLYLIRAAGYTKQYLRPMATQMTGQVVNRMGNILDRFQDGKVPTSALSSLTSEFLLPTASPERLRNPRDPKGRFLEVTVPNGWGEERFTFVMGVRVTTGNMETVEVVSGYTDRMDTAVQGGDVFIAPDTVFYINNIAKISQRTLNNVSIPRIRDSFSVMGGGLGDQAYEGQVTTKMTPAMLLDAAYMSGIDGLSSIPPQNRIIDSHYVTSIPTVTRRTNSSATNMVSKVVESYVAQHNTEIIGGIPTQDAANYIRGHISDPSVYDVSFMTVLSSYTSGTQSTFDWGTLQQLDQWIDEKAEVQSMEYTTDQYESPWHAPTRESQMAIVVSTMVSSLMTNHSLSAIDFQSTNMVSGNFGMGPTHLTEVTSARGISSVQNQFLVDQYNLFKQIIDDEIVQVISSNHEVEYELYVSATINQDIVIEIGFGGNQTSSYAFPSFADSLISPMLTTNQDLCRRNASDIGTLMDNMTEMRVSNMAPNEVWAPNSTVNTHGGFGYRYDDNATKEPEPNLSGNY